MTRARALALALVNWKGVFYERYLLHRHVTALEGANGAGKTTVMIAAYVVLLPDMSRLRFTNLGESGATGGDKGIWGRLGEAARPSYAALDLELPSGERLIAGVELRKKAEPSVEPTPFLITKIESSVRLQDLLLLGRDGHDEVPELAELKQNAKRLGGECEAFASTKEYLAALFEKGVTPLRLGTDEERRKFNEMLRTSMTGGISRALTTELRSFLLKEETGLAESLVHMRANLDACKRTRVEVAEAQRLDLEIAGVYTAARRMLAAALEATWAHERELDADRAAAEERLRLEEQKLARAAAAAQEAARRHDALIEQRERARAALLEREAERARSIRARELAAKLQSATLELAKKALERDAALERRERAARAREERAHRREQARDEYETATRGVTNLELGLEELHRRAHAAKIARQRLAEARELLPDPKFEAADAEARLETARADKSRIDAERVRLDRENELASARRSEFDAGLAALRRIVPDASAESAWATARAVLASFSELERQSANEPSLTKELEQTRRLAVRQRELRSSLELLAASEGLGVVGGASWLANALERAEAERLELAAASSRAASQLDDERRAEAAAHEELRELEARSKELALARATLGRIAGAERSAPWTYDALAELAQRLMNERDALKRRVEELEHDRSRTERRRAELETELGSVDPALLALCDELDAELLSSRFDELEAEPAGRLQARLGDLSRAVVVSDPEAAARKLAGAEREIGTVWLVSPDFEAPSELASGSSDVIVRDGAVLRVTRVPVRPTLGRAARLRRAAELGVEAQTFAAEIEAAEPRLRRLDAGLDELRGLFGKTALFALGDVEAELAARRQRIAEARSARERLELELELARARTTALDVSIRELRRVLPDAALLDPPDHGTRAEQLGQELDAARLASAELSRVSNAQAELPDVLDALRTPPPTDFELARRAEQRTRLEAQRDRAFELVEVLADLLERREALRFEHDDGALVRAELLPALEEQRRLARAALREAEARLDAAQAEWEATNGIWQKAEAEWAALEPRRMELEQELEREGPSDASEARRRELESTLEVARLELERLEREERTLATEIAVELERREQLDRALAATRDRARAAAARAAPVVAEREKLRARLQSVGIDEHDPIVLSHELGGSAGTWAEARTQREILFERVGTARHGAELTHALSAVFAGEPSGWDAEVHCNAWLAVRAWLARRIPSQLWQGADPLAGLERLRDHLAALARRLERQERDLRGASEDIARGVEVQIRRAKQQVRRLGQSLEGVRFGSVHAIRVRMERVERMERILQALREGAAQEFLFQRALPIEEALEEVFRRYGGGRGGGHRLLDYREYVELAVEVQRRGNQEWEPANPTRLSTGEAIGVGAALMMVVLTEWERDANLLRGRREHGSLRFLFLDEANRLSHDNLGTLFDLCRTLDLQLLIAAPEVARAEGNTTYRLVRTVNPDGDEEVVVSGRRASSEGDESADANSSAQLPLN